MNKVYTMLFLTLLFSPTLPLSAKEISMSSPIIDLTYPFNEKTLYWPTEEAFDKQVEFHGITEKGYFYSANRLHLAEHGGTHLDAPIHFNQHGKSVEAIPLADLIGPGVLIDVSSKALKSRDYQVGIEDIENFEKNQGTIPSGSIVLLKTGYGQYWPHAKKYLGTAEKGSKGVSQLHFPGLSPDAARFLVLERKIKAVGIDTASIDYGQSTEFMSHRILAEHQKPIFENLAELDKLPEKNFEVIALPMKISGGSGAPLRVIVKIKK